MQDDHSVADVYAFEPAGPKGIPPSGASWKELMLLALEEARKAGLLGDCPVGAVITDRQGRILANAHNRVEGWHNPAAHAEMLAIMRASQRLASPRLEGCILVVTLEPCLMCAGAIAQSRLAGVVFGAADSRAGALVSAHDACGLPFGGRSFWHLGGIMGQECASLLQDFFAERRG